MERRYINVNELSEFIGIPKGTLYVWVCQKRIPYVKIGGLLRFDLREIDSWIKERSFKVLEFGEVRNRSKNSYY
jgi:excisionase family DNA binding protein